MGTAANFPTALYVTDSTILNTVLTRAEWQQIAVETEQIEANIGTSAAGAFTSIRVRLDSYGSSGINATGHGALGTAGTHPFSALTGTFTALQHGNLTGTAATHDHAGTGIFYVGPTAAVTVAGQVQSFSTGFLAGLTSRDTNNSAESYVGPADGDKVIVGSMTGHPFHIRTNNALRMGIDSGGTITAMPALPATAHGSLGTAATHPFSALTGTFVATQHGSLGTAATHPFSALTTVLTATQHGAPDTSGTHPFSALTGTFVATQHGDLSGSTAAVHTGSAIIGILTATAHGSNSQLITDLHLFSQISGALLASQHGSLSTAATHPFSALTGTFTAAQHGALGTSATHVMTSLTNTFNGFKDNSAQYTVTTSIADIPSFSLTLGTSGTYLISAGFEGIMLTGSAGSTAILECVIANSADADISWRARYTAGRPDWIIPLYTTYLWTPTASGLIIKGRAVRVGPTSGTLTIEASNTYILATKIA